MRTMITTGAVVLLAVAGLLVLVLLPGSGAGTDARTAGPVLGAGDREALAAPAGTPVTGAGRDPLPRDPAVDPHDPAAVAAAYLMVAHGTVPEDAGRPHRRAAGWAEPGSVPEQVGVVVLDAPPVGAVRTARVTGLDLVAADPGDARRLYRAVVVTTTAPAGTETTDAVDVVVVRQPDGQWLVRSAGPADVLTGDD